MPSLNIPIVQNCCFCVTDLKAAAAIIAILGIVTSPVVSWAVIRHSYIIRMACFVTAHEQQPDVVDINLHNIITFGFGPNAGLEPSCMVSKSHNSSSDPVAEDKKLDTQFVYSIRWVGWLVLAVDIIFVGVCVNFLYRLFKPLSRDHQIKTTRLFLWSCIAAILLSFIYGMLHVAACVVVGGSFPIFEFVFSLFDVALWAMWVYFIIVIRSYLVQLQHTYAVESIPKDWYSQFVDYFYSIWTSMKNAPLELPRYLLTCLLTYCLYWFSVWSYFMIVIRSYVNQNTLSMSPKPNKRSGRESPGTPVSLATD